jgi:4-amino-4-deoxy-L-arabinose transferase-like glycosyltransferase
MAAGQQEAVMHRVPRIFWILLLAGFLLRIVAIQVRTPMALVHAPDEREYYELAWNLAHGAGFSIAGEPTAYRSVLFPALASVVLHVTGQSPRPIFYLQALLSCLTALLLYQLAGHRFGQRGAFYAGAAWLFLPTAVLSCALFLTTTLFSFLWVLALALYDRLQYRGFHYVDALWLGLAVGATALTRMVGLFLLLAVVIYLAFIRYEVWQRTQWRMALTVLAGAAILTVPWMARNAAVVGRFAVNTNSGMALLLDPAPEMSRDQDPPSRDVVTHLRSTPGSMLPDPVGGADDSVLLQSRPLDTVSLWVRKLVRLWATDLGLWVRYSLAGPPAEAVMHLRQTPLLPLIVASFPTLLLAGIGLSGFSLVRRFPSRGLYILQFCLVLVALFSTYGVPRDVVPFLPCLLIGGAALWRLPRWQRLPVWQRAVHGGVLALLGGLWILATVTIAGW